MSKGKSNYTLVTTVYNDEKNIIGLLEEIQKQTYPPNEIVIADGGSNDKTIDVINEFKKKTSMNIKIIQKGRLNISQGFNVAINNSENNYVGIIACGNHYSKNYFDNLVSVLDKQKDVDIAYGKVQGDEATIFKKTYSRIMFGPENMFASMPSNHGNLIRKEVYQEEGLFYEKFSYAGEDYEFFKRVMHNGRVTYCDKDAVCIWDVPEDMKQYKKQLENYTIADMEMFSNKIFTKRYFRRMCYCMPYFCVIMLLCPLIICKIIGILFIAYLLINNIILLKKGKIYYCIKQVKNTYWLFIVLKNMKLLKKSNKIENPITFA